MRRYPCLPAAALVMAVFSWTSNTRVAEAAQPRACTLITNINQLQAMRNNLAGDYCLANDIDASTNPNFAPIGDSTTPFTGSLNGKGHVISNLIIRSGKSQVGLFGVIDAAVVENITLLNINVRGFADNALVGGLAGYARFGGPDSITISRVNVSGRVRCSGTPCDAGGIFGAFGTSGGIEILKDSSSSAEVIGTRWVGGAVGQMLAASIARTYATGAVTCTGTECMVAGLVARPSSSVIHRSFATGPVLAAGSGFTRAGGLTAYNESATTITQSYAAAPVMGGVDGYAGGLVAQWNATEPLDQSYAVGPVGSSGATTGGLAANAWDGAVVTNSYWDTDTTGQATSDEGTGLTTAQLRMALPTGFGNSWGITPDLSYPFLTAAQIGFASPLATLVRTNKVFTFLPISQLDDFEYLIPPMHANRASLATVYTMIARAIGITQNVPKLKNVKIDRYFWDDATQNARWQGPVKNYAMLGAFANIAGATPLDATNVIGAMDLQQLVILRGRYTTGAGTIAAHWMLGTLYREEGGNPSAVIAHDPWTGRQVSIDPATKRVVRPANFPLANFKINGYQPVTVN